ncbi:hypothetical protein TSAR_004302, partial [Trichomalopsis sarcophagae]
TEELGRYVIQDEKDVRLLTFVEIALPRVYKTVAARIAQDSGFDGANEKVDKKQRPSENAVITCTTSETYQRWTAKYLSTKGSVRTQSHRGLQSFVRHATSCVREILKPSRTRDF